MQKARLRGIGGSRHGTTTAICFWPRVLGGAGWAKSRENSTQSQTSTDTLSALL
jgi:hypothetical protein